MLDSPHTPSKVSSRLELKTRKDSRFLLCLDEFASSPVKPRVRYIPLSSPSVLRPAPRSPPPLETTQDTPSLANPNPDPGLKAASLSLTLALLRSRSEWPIIVERLGTSTARTSTARAARFRVTPSMERHARPHCAAESARLWASRATERTYIVSLGS